MDLCFLNWGNRADIELPPADAVGLAGAFRTEANFETKCRDGANWDSMGQEPARSQSIRRICKFVPHVLQSPCNLLAISLQSKVNRTHQRLNGAMREDWSVPQFHEGVSDPPPLFLPVWSLTSFASNEVLMWKTWKCAKVLCSIVPCLRWVMCGQSSLTTFARMALQERITFKGDKQAETVPCHITTRSKRCEKEIQRQTMNLYEPLWTSKLQTEGLWMSLGLFSYLVIHQDLVADVNDWMTCLQCDYRTWSNHWVHHPWLFNWDQYIHY